MSNPCSSLRYELSKPIAPLVDRDPLHKSRLLGFEEVTDLGQRQSRSTSIFESVKASVCAALALIRVDEEEDDIQDGPSEQVGDLGVGDTKLGVANLKRIDPLERNGQEFESVISQFLQGRFRLGPEVDHKATILTFLSSLLVKMGLPEASFGPCLGYSRTCEVPLNSPFSRRSSAVS